MLFDINLLFYKSAVKANAFTAGEYMSLVGSTTGSTGLVINLGNPRDLGQGNAGEFAANVAVYVGTSFSSTCSSMKINAEFQGSTDSVTWNTYAESGPLTTASYQANQAVFPQVVPQRVQGLALPQYYRLNLVVSGNLVSESISTGTLIGGIIIDRDAPDNSGIAGGGYPSGFTVA